LEPLTILMNAHAGLGRRGPEIELAKALAAHGITAVIEPVEPRRLAARVANLAGRPTLGVAGGDGTQRTAARVLVGSGTTLVPFPTGRLNHFARRLGLDTIDRVAASVAEGRVRSVAVGRVNDHVFVNTAVVGSYPGLVKTRERLRPFLTTWPAAAIASLYQLARWAPVTLVVRTPDAERECRTTMFWVGIGKGSFPAPHEAPVTTAAGDLEIVVLPGTSRLAAVRLVRALAGIKRGRPPSASGLNVIHTRSVEVHSHRSLPIALDGEPRWLDPPLRFRFEPDALRVVAPCSPGGGARRDDRRRGAGQHPATPGCGRRGDGARPTHDSGPLTEKGGPVPDRSHARPRSVTSHR
jgi:diacylglycerol kinase family enzyme